MAADGSIENFQIRANFFVLGDFLTFFVSKCPTQNSLSEYLIGFFHILGVTPKIGPKVKKVGPET